MKQTWNDYLRRYWQQKRRHRRHFYIRSYKTKVDAEQSSIIMLNNTKEIEKNILVIKDHNGKLITDPTEKANSINSYYASLFIRESNIPQIQSTIG